VPTRKKARKTATPKKKATSTTKKAAKTARGRKAKKKSSKKTGKKTTTKKQAAKKKAAKKTAKKKTAKKTPKKKAAKKKTAKKKVTKKSGRRAALGKKAAKSRIKKRKKKKAARRRRKKPLTKVAIGDVISVPGRVRGEAERAGPSWGTGAPAETVLGLVCSIRAIATGKLVGRTRGDLSKYLLEVIHSESFAAQGPPSVNREQRRLSRLRQNPAWSQTRALLRELADKKDLVSAVSSRLSQEPFDSLLNGWRVVKVKGDQVEAPE